MGPPPVPAKYVPDKTRPMLVLVENYQHQSSAHVHGDLLARHLVVALEANAVAPIVAPEKLQSLRDNRAGEYPTMSITSIGRTVGAQQVLYVQLVSSDVTPLAGGEGFTGHAEALVKLVDAETGNTLWPTDLTDGYGVSAQTQLATAGVAGARSAGDPMEVRRLLYAQLADQISKLFHKWKPDDMAPEGYVE